nr:recombinase family protein [Amycolatopsis acidicola]
MSDSTTSPARQREVVEQWSRFQQGELVHVAEDLDVSGAVSPFEREGLGPWLNDPAKMARWDVLVAWKLDRISRSALDTLMLLQWAEEHGKRIVAVADSLDSQSQMGRVWIQLAAIFAEVERTNTKERVLAARAHLRLTGKHAGGRPPYGYRSVADGTGNRVLEIDEEQSLILRGIVEDVLDGNSLGSIVSSLNGYGVPSPRSGEALKRGRKEWTVNGLRDLLRAQSLRGWSTYRGNPVLGPDGAPVKRGPELLDAATFQALQEELDRRKAELPERRATRSPRASLLLNVAFCECGGRLVAGVTGHGGRRYACIESRAVKPDRCRIVQTVNAGPLEDYARREFLAVMGSQPVVEVILTPGVDYSAEIREARSSLERLDEAFTAGAYEGDVDTFTTLRRGIRSRIDRLEAEPARPPTTEVRETGRTFAELWAVGSTADRRDLMLRAGFRVEVGPARGRGRYARIEERFTPVWGPPEQETFDDYIES